MAGNILSDNYGCLYRLTSPNGKQYIGITLKTAHERFKKHLRSANTGKSNCAIHNAIRKYGASSIKIETLVIAHWVYLKDLESLAIMAFRTKYPEGYNLTNGGEGTAGIFRSEEYKARMSETKKKQGIKPTAAHIERLKIINSSRIRSPEERLKCSLAHKGKPKSAAHIEKMRAISAGKKLTEAAKEKVSAFNKGKILSAETRAKISAAKLGVKKSPECIAKSVATRKSNIAARRLNNASNGPTQ